MFNNASSSSYKVSGSVDAKYEKENPGVSRKGKSLQIKELQLLLDTWIYKFILTH